MISTSVVIPVLDGERYLAEVLVAVADEEPSEILVIDSGSHDGSVAIARATGVELIEIPKREFGHGRTRNLGCERTSGQLVCFLTQDATPVPGWLAAYAEVFAAEPQVGVAYGPHLPREDTSPMIARELTEFFATFSPRGDLTVQRSDRPFLSNVNASYRRTCWDDIRFRDVAYAEDQAFARDLATTRWRAAYQPRAAVLHAHDYGQVEFMRRYFDEYRGLRATTGHVEMLGWSTLRHVRDQVAEDLRWMTRQRVPSGSRTGWTARAAVHHGGRALAAAAGSHSGRLPARLREAVSLEGRNDAAPVSDLHVGPPLEPTYQPVPARLSRATYDSIAYMVREGPVPLADPVPDMAERERLHVAVALPPFMRGSGGHSTALHLIRGLEARGHTCSIWFDDPLGHQNERAAVTHRKLVDYFGPFHAPLYRDWEGWFGADVLLATGWQTVYPVLARGACRARAYLVQDHEPEFYPTSVESWYARRTYDYELFCICASPWLRDLLAERHGRRGSTFRLGVDQRIYAPKPVPRDPKTVVFYARDSTPRRAVGLGLLALSELHLRRPEVRIVLYGSEDPAFTTFPYDHAGLLSPEQLAGLYARARVGICLSMTNYSLAPQDMMACGLPCVDLKGFSAESVFGPSGPVELAEFDPLALADSMERLLDDDERWGERSQAGLAFVAEHTWPAAAREVEEGLRTALRDAELVHAR